MANLLICDDTPKTAEQSEFNTLDGFEKACSDALALAKSLGNGWAGRVWENIGWHYKAESPCRRIDVHPSIYGRKVHSYTAFLHKPGADGHPAYLGETGSGKTPKAAVASVIRNAKARVAEIQSIVEGL